MDPRSQFCHNEECPARGQVGEDNIGIHSLKERRYICHTCKGTFAETKGTPMYRLHKGIDVFLLVVGLCSHGCPLQAIVAVFKLDERTVASWLLKAGVHCKGVHEHLVQNVELQQVQADELWIKLVGRRVWMAMAICVPSRLWLGGEVNHRRDKQLARALATRVRAVAASAKVLVCTDGYSGYVKAFRKLWRQPVYTGKKGRPRLVEEAGLLVAQGVKQYLQRRVIGVMPRVAVGAEQAVEQVLELTGCSVINTAYIERLNATFRARLAPLVRRTRGQARKTERLEAGMWLVGCCYNWCWAHHSLRVASAAGGKWRERTPAMAAGLTDHIWSLEEVLSYKVALPAWAPTKRRGRRPKQATHSLP